jgi:Nucleotidyl transferase AbiEii toxin, Type IV TA system
MTSWLKLTPNQRRVVITEVEYVTGVTAKAIEKDWWVTLVLQALFRSTFSKHIVFKGGTSLSKCWKLITRFSEDIDIALNSEAFGIKYEKAPSKNYVEKLRRVGCMFTSNELKMEIEKQLQSLGLPLVTIEAEPIPLNRPDTDPQTLHIKYPSLYEPNLYIADEVKIEVSVRSLQWPYSRVEISSMISEGSPSEAYTETPFAIEAVEPHKTFLEKVFLLHEEFSKPDMTKIRSERMSRHLYDLAAMTGTAVEARALVDDELYFSLIAHRKAYQRISWVNYESLSYSTISFLPPSEVIGLYEKDYQTMQEQMIYGKTVPFGELIDRLRALQQRFRAKGYTDNS